MLSRKSTASFKACGKRCRRARQAARYRNLSGLIHKADALLFLLRWRDFEALSRANEETLRTASHTVAERTERAAEISVRRTDAAASLPPLRDAEAAKGAGLQRLVHERNNLDADVAPARETKPNACASALVFPNRISRASTLEQDAAAALADISGECAELAQANSTAGIELTEAEEAALALAQHLNERERLLERLTAELRRSQRHALEL